MNKVAMALAGVLIFFAGMMAGNLFDFPREVSASPSWESGVIELIGNQKHTVKWNGTSIQVYVSERGAIPVRFKRWKDSLGR